MKKLFLFFLGSAIIQLAEAQEGKVIARDPEIITGQLVRIAGPLSQMRAGDGIPFVKVRDENGIIGKDEAFEEGEDAPRYPSSNIFAEDPALQRFYPNLPHVNPNRAILSNFAGLGYTSVNPPDPTLCVGPNHVIQMINAASGAVFKIFNKSGTQLVGQTFLDAVTGKGGLGDPIALYDQLADRYVLTEFANSPETGSEGLIFAVSQTPDPTGAWFVYFFSTGTTFPDYPKMSVWPDAYYATTNDFANGTTYAGSTVYAFDRTKMLAGNATATVQKFTLGNTNKYFSMCPVLLQGTTTPPAGSGGLIAYMQDDTWTTSATDVDSIGLIEFNVNFTTPSLTRVVAKSSLNVTAFKSDICTATRGRCISQPGSTIALEALHQKIQNQPVYRRFGSYEGIVLVHAVDKGTNISGIRWYELRKTTGNWAINQQATYAPDNTHRWLPGICYDANGNIALAYNVSSSATGVFGGARYTGRKECDPLNTMTYVEDVIIAGTAANASNRYGDYNHLVCDPNGTTFWFTAEYNAASTWSTRVASFTLDPCTPALCGDPTGLTTSAITNTSASVSWTAVASAISYDVDYKASSSTTWINAATATTATSVALSTLTQGTTYDWRVRATCTAGSGNYIQAQFTTTAPCGTPVGLASSGVTSSAATVSWTALSGALNYSVDYKLTTATTWTVATASTTATSVNITGLVATSTYDWRVRATCASGPGAYAQAQFTTTAVSVCPGPLDVSTNGTMAGAATIPFNTTVNGLISPAGDNDYYKFVITNPGTFTVTLANLPGDYDIRLYRGTTQVAISQNGGTTAETITFTATAATYYVRVYGFSNANNSTVCYALKVQLGTASAPELAPSFDNNINVTLYPNPADQTVTVKASGIRNTADIRVVDISGQVVMKSSVSGASRQLNVSSLKPGVYLVQVSEGNQMSSIRFVKQ